VKRLKDLELENSRLRKAVSDLTLDKLILQEAARGILSPARRSALKPLHAFLQTKRVNRPRAPFASDGPGLHDVFTSTACKFLPPVSAV